MSNIEKLYYNMDKLNDDYMDSDEVRQARGNVESVLGREVYFKCESEILSLASVNEKQGFILGFQYAVSLLTSGKAAKI